MASGNPTINPFPADIDREAFGHWLSGFAAGEATFGLRMDLCKKRVRPFYKAFFRITLRDDDSETLQLVQSYWGCGTLHFSDNSRSKIPNAKPTVMFGVQSVTAIVETVIPHFERYPLRAKKRKDFNVWKQAVDLMASVQNRVLKYRPGRAPNRHGGTYPKWTDVEINLFTSLSEELKNQRKYEYIIPPENSAVRPKRDAQGTFFGDDG